MGAGLGQRSAVTILPASKAVRGDGVLPPGATPHLL